MNVMKGWGGPTSCVSQLATNVCMDTGRCAQRTYVNACVSTLVCVVTHRDIQMYERIECPNLKGELL